MVVTPQLTPHAIPQLLAGNSDIKPVLQCVGSRAAQHESQKWRIALSDGEQWVQCVLATQLSHMMESNQVEIGSILRIQECMVQNVNMNSKGPDQPPRWQRTIIILKLVVLGAAIRINEPQQLNTDLSGPNDNRFSTANGAQPNGSAYGQSSAYGGARQNTYGQDNAMNGAHEAPQRGSYGTGAYGAPGAPAGQGNGAMGGSIYGRPTYGQPASTSPRNGNQSGAYGGTSNGAYGAGNGGNAYGGYGRGANGNQASSSAYGESGGQLVGGYGQAPSYRASGSAIARSEAPPKIVPIASLNAYQNRWTIKARVTVKSDMRRWSNPRGEGKFFTVDLLDSQGGEIRAIAFNDQAEKFDPILQQGGVFMISKASLKHKKPGSNYNQTNHDHEITLEKATIIEPCEEDQETQAIPALQYQFRRIEEIEVMPAKTQLDVLGVVEAIDQAGEIPRRDGSTVNKRSLTIKDESNKSIELTLWDAFAFEPGNEIEQLFAQGERPILAIKGVRVGDFNGKTLSSISQSNIRINPTDQQEAARLRQWYDVQGGANLTAVRLSDQRGGGGREARRCNLAAIKDQGLGTDGAPAFVQVLCWVTYIKQENMSYPACSHQYQGRTCNKKLTDQTGDGTSWYCERCQVETQPDWRYILQVQADDFSSHVWLTAFQESGVEIIGKTATELRELEQTNTDAFDELMLTTSHKLFLFKVKVAEDTYQDETKIKTSIIKAETPDFPKECRVLLENIGKLDRGEPVNAAPSPMGGGQAFGGYGGNTGGYGGGRGGGWGSTTPGRVPQAHNSAYGEGGGFGGQGSSAYGSWGYGNNNSRQGGGGGFGASGAYGGSRQGGYGQGGF